MHTYGSLVALIGFLTCSACLAADAPPSRSSNAADRSEPASAQQASAEQPTNPKPTSGDAKIDAILDRLDEKGHVIKGIKSRLTYTYIVVDPVESRQVKEGTLLFARSEPNSRFLVHFDRTIADGVVNRSGEYYGFDGRWMIERNDRAKNIIKRELAREGQYRDPFKLGEGPFPLPFGQSRADILKNFRVALVPFALGDPLQSDHLRCIPLPGTEMAQKYSRVDIYVDRRIDLPVRIVSENLKDGNRIEVDFKDISAGEAPAASRFHIEEPKDFEVRTERLNESASEGALR